MTQTESSLCEFRAKHLSKMKKDAREVSKK